MQFVTMVTKQSYLMNEATKLDNFINYALWKLKIKHFLEKKLWEIMIIAPPTSIVANTLVLLTSTITT
jgi:hypothetical protein